MKNTSMTRTRARERRAKGAPQIVAASFMAFALYAAGFIGVFEQSPFFNVAALCVLGVVALYARRHHRVLGAPSLGEALSVLAMAFVVSRIAVGVGVEAYGLVFLAVAWAFIAGPKKVGFITAVLAGAVEIISHLLGTAASLTVGFELIEGWEGLGIGVLLSRLMLLSAFSLLAWGLVGRQATRQRQVREREVEKERRRLLEEAREFRLIHAGRAKSTLDREEAQELILRDAVEAVYHTTFMTLELVKAALQAQTVVLLWFDLRNERLKIKELVSDSDDLIEGAIDPAGGVIGGITRRRDMVRLSELRPGFRGLAYYHKPSGATEFIGMPIIEQGHLRGVLCVDRAQGRAFDEEDARLVEEAAGFVLRAVEKERMVASIEQTRFEVGRFFEASRRLNSVLTPDEVYEVALDSISQIVAYDFAAITLYDEELDRHQVVCVEGQGARSQRGWDRLFFSANKGLVSMVVRNRHYLPVGGRLRDRQALVMSAEQDFSELQSLLVMPLIVQDRALGTMIVGHFEAEQFRSERREMLEVVANQVAITIQNARLYAQMENMAHFDALTGLANRRAFQNKLHEAMARHKRSGRVFGLVITDIDHFKSVNDTYGHPVGDEVLRQVGRLFQEQLREIDVPARYGGEEFVLILEDTDLEGARHVANRLREAFAALRFETEQGVLQCTISMGIAMGPWDSDEAHTLIDLADQALYYSKENGRNQVSVYREIAPAGAAA